METVTSKAEAIRWLKRSLDAVEEAHLAETRLAIMRFHSTIIWSAHSTRETKIAGLPNFAPQLFRSASVTPRAREQAPQEKTGMRFATIFSIVSLSAGQPTGMTALTVGLRIK